MPAWLGPVFGFLGGLLKPLIAPVIAWWAGRKSAQAKAANQNLERVDDATKARDHARTDPDERERLYRKYGDGE